MNSLIDKILSHWFALNQKLRYLIVGGYNTGFAYAVFCVLGFFLENYLHYLVILVLCYIISITNSFINFRFFVFRSKGNWRNEYFKTNIVYFWHFLLNAFLLFIFKDKLNMNIFFAQFLCVTILIIAVYFAHKHFSFKSYEKKTS